MGHFRRDERYAAHFQPSIYSEGVTGSYADYGDTTGAQYTHFWGGEGKALYKDAKEALDKAKDGDPLDSFQAEDLTLDQGIEDVSTESGDNWLSKQPWSVSPSFYCHVLGFSQAER